MEIRFAASADRHGISHERSRYVVEHCGYVYPDEDIFFCFGDDVNGVPLEVGYVEVEDNTVLVIHAMRLRAQYVRLYVESLPWRK
jgi:hypothetical protein